ncbi:MAG: phytanoyl-CoA dioxygenase family protein, partial [Vicinamibacterales bacterium]
MASLPTPGRVFERDGRTVRALHGCHLHSPIMKNLACLRRLVKVAMALVEDDVYIYQFKINMKAAFSGDVWKWHQDFIYWRDEDGMPECRVVNIGLYLDDVTEMNGPLLVIPGSHRGGVIDGHA